MTYNHIVDSPLPLPISQQTKLIAQQLADQLAVIAVDERVYLNTLAVLVVNDYLQMMGFATDLRGSETFNPLLHLAADVSDLQVTGLGHLECRAVTPGELSCYIPEDVWQDRIGYAVVEIAESQRLALLLGFTQSVTEASLPLKQLQPPEFLLRHLHQLMQELNSVNTVVISQWFENLFVAGWQNLEALFAGDTLNLALSLRSDPAPEREVVGAKLIDWGVDLGGEAVTLLVALTKITDEQVGVRVQVRPVTGASYLPPNLVLAICSPTGETLREVRSRSLDDYIQLPRFQGVRGDRFQLRLTLNQVSLTEDLAI